MSDEGGTHGNDARSESDHADADADGKCDRSSDGNGNGDLVAELLAGNHRALARTITRIEDRAPGYRDLVSALHEHTGNADVIGITGSPGSGKSTLVDRMAEHYREEGLTVGIIGVDPSSPFTGGAVLGDRIRMSATTGDMEVFFRSMSARGSLGGLSTATADAVKALDAFGKDKVIIETVGAGQNEIDVVKTADTVCVLVPPGSGDDVQMLKAGILEIGDVFVVNKADLDGSDRTVTELREMIEGRSDRLSSLDASHHDQQGHHECRETEAGGQSSETGTTALQDDESASSGDGENGGHWKPRIIETVAKSGAGVGDFLAALDAHRQYLTESGRFERRIRERYAEEIRALLREDSSALIEREVASRGGIDAFVDRVVGGESDPYAIVEEVLAPLRECVSTRQADVRARDEEG